MNSIWFEDYYQKKLPDRGFVLVSWPSRSDASLAPEGHHCLNLVTFAPYELAEGDWDSLKEQYPENQLDLLEKKLAWTSGTTSPWLR